jgi:hypothetical protein
MDMKYLLGGVALVFAGALVLAGCQKAANNTTATPAAVATNSPPAATAAATSDADDVKAFLEGIYAHYKTSSETSNYQPFDANGPEVLDADTLALMKADTKALNGDLGAIDADWLCACQDYTSIKSTIAVQSATATAAKASSDFKDVDDTTAKPRHDTFDLVKTAAGWRIHDMETDGPPSLRKVLQDEIRKLKTSPTPGGGADEAP